MKTDEASWSPEGTVSYWVNRAARSLGRHLDEGLRPFGFAMSHLPVLRALGQTRALSQRQLAEAAHVEQPTMTQMLARMERDGVIQREADPDDRRANLISLTRLARARFPRAKAALIEAEHEALAGFSEGEKAQLRGLLQRVVDNVERSAARRDEASRPGRGES